MRQSKSIFFPIPNQFQDEKIFAKRYTLYKRHLESNYDNQLQHRHNSSKLNIHYSEAVIGNKNERKTSIGATVSAKVDADGCPIHDTYSNMKRKLQDYILKEKNKISLRINTQQYKLANAKSKFILRKKCNHQRKKQTNSTVFIPSEEVKLSITENLMNLRQKFKKSSMKGATVCCVNDDEQMQLKLSPIVRYERSNTDEQVGDNKVASNMAKRDGGERRSQSQQSPIFKTYYNRRKQIRSTLDGVNSRAVDIHNKTEVIVCKGFKSLEIDDLERKKHQLIKINHELKMRSSIKAKFHERTSLQKGNDVGPWSKTHLLEEEEGCFQHNSHENQA